MGSIDKFQCGCIGSGGLERLRYFPRELLTADKLRAEQDYFLEKQRRHNRFMHGWGVVCGLVVKPDPNAGPLALIICPGYALSPFGNEIHVADAQPYDLTPTLQQLAQPACANPGLSGAALAGGPLAIMIRYAECMTRPERTLPAGCGCDDSDCEFSRIRDSFEIRAVPKDKELAMLAPSSVCEIQHDIAGKLPPMPSPPTSDWLQLAVVDLNGAKTVTAALIDNNSRRVLYSTAQVQSQVIDNCD
ncbi:MAG: hypothetical protein ABI605_12575 [Rhizobacter sp.]